MEVKIDNSSFEGKMCSLDGDCALFLVDYENEKSQYECKLSKKVILSYK